MLFLFRPEEPSGAQDNTSSPSPSSHTDENNLEGSEKPTPSHHIEENNLKEDDKK